MTCELEHKIFTLTDTDFPEAALAIFQFQARYNPVYRDFIQALAIDPLTVTNVAAINPPSSGGVPPNFHDDTLIFKIALRDQAKHISDTVTTQAIIITR